MFIFFKSHIKTPVVTDISPNFGPKIGGTRITLSGKHLDAGQTRTVQMGDKIYNVERFLAIQYVCGYIIYSTLALLP